jgi:two-component system, cell cycle response regulator
MDQSRQKLLIIDDSADIHRILTTKLRSEEVEILSAMNAEEALALATLDRPAVILLDIDLGSNEDGLFVLRRLMSDPTTMHISVIMLSSSSSPQVKVAAFDLGATDFISKPFEIAEVRVRIRSALRMQMLMKMLSQRAQIDGLTGLWNRAYFEQRWGEEFKRAQRSGQALSVAMLDIDHFKSVNDSFGHHAGDAALQGFARVLQSQIRGSDIACRYGGEEFVLVMTETTPENAKVLCERIRVAVAQTVWPRHPTRALTVSTGIAGSANASVATGDDWVELADKSLYMAKNSGRNRIEVIDLSGGLPASRSKVA